MKYINVFEKNSDYLAVKDTLEKPLLAYISETGGVVSQSVVVDPPTPVGPADNEIWYTTTDGLIFDISACMDMMSEDAYLGNHIISNEFDETKNKWVVICKNDVSIIGLDFDNITIYPILSDFTSETGIGRLTSVDLPISLRYVLRNACIANVSLYSITIPEGTLGLYESAFYGSQFITVSLPSTLTFINKTVLAEDSYLEMINYNGTKAQWNSITKGDDWHYHCPSTAYVQCTDGKCTLDGEPINE